MVFFSREISALYSVSWLSSSHLYEEPKMNSVLSSRSQSIGGFLLLLEEQGTDYKKPLKERTLRSREPTSCGRIWEVGVFKQLGPTWGCCTGDCRLALEGKGGRSIALGNLELESIFCPRLLRWFFRYLS